MDNRKGALKITHYIIQIKFFIILHTTVCVFKYEHYRIGQDLNRNSATLITHYILCDGTLSSFFENKTGLKQGDPLSPILFNLAL